MQIKEFFDDNGNELKEVLKECIFGYYEKYKSKLLYEFSKQDTDNITEIISSRRKESINVH